jgi:hypothetical protein
LTVFVGAAWADAPAVIAAAAQILAARFDVGPDVGPDVGGTPVWEVAVSVSGGLLLAPGWAHLVRLEWINAIRL